MSSASVLEQVGHRGYESQRGFHWDNNVRQALNEKKLDSRFLLTKRRDRVKKSVCAITLQKSEGQRIETLNMVRLLRRCKDVDGVN